MPTNGTFSGAPIPNRGEAGDGPANFAAYDAIVGSRLVLPATSQSNRDTLYANLPAGALVSCAALGIVWQKTTTPPTAATWKVIAENGPVVTTGIVTAATNFTISSQWARRVNGENQIRIKLSYSGADLVGGAVTAADPGSLTDTTMCSLQSTWQVLDASYGLWFACLAGSAGGWVQITAANDIKLAALSPSGKVSAGDSVLFSVKYPGV